MSERPRERLAAVRTHGLRFDVNCSILFTELPLLKRPAAARAAGFDAVEFWWPFADPVLRKDPRVYPPKKQMDALMMHHVLDPEQSELWNETWADVKVA